MMLRNEENLPSRSATFGIMIGDPAYLDRGYGTEASTLLLDYAFAVLGYHKINLDFFEYNARAQAMYEKLGFVLEGRRRENHWSRGRFWDDILMGVTAEEWWTKHGPPQTTRTRTRALMVAQESSFTVFPAIDLRGGKCVRLKQGDFGRSKEYDADPVERAREWERQGASGDPRRRPRRRRDGQARPARAHSRIASAVDVPLQVGGGIRTLEDLRAAREAGAERVVMGTAAVEDRELRLRAVEAAGDFAGRRRRCPRGSRRDARLAPVERGLRPGPLRRAGRRRRCVGPVHGRGARRHGRGGGPRRHRGRRKNNPHHRQRGRPRGRRRGRALQNARCRRRGGRHRALRGQGHANGADGDLGAFLT